MDNTSNLQEKIKAMNQEYEKNQKELKRKHVSATPAPSTKTCEPKMATRDKMLVAVSAVEFAFYVLAIIALIRFLAS